MAQTNTNTGSYSLSTDIYDIANFIDAIRTDHVTDVDATSAMVGIFGYITEIHSQSLQDVLIRISETTNEAIPTKAKFHKNVLAHAMNLAITDIYAKPATMTMRLHLPIDYIKQNFVEHNPTSGKAKFILDKNIPIHVNNFEFHLDYDIIINRTKNSSGEYIYTALYDLFDNTGKISKKNPLSDITNPYITTLIKTTIENTEYLSLSVRLHQVAINTVSTNILTDNIIENKSVTFEFQDQLAAFDVDVVEADGSVKHLTPIYSGLLDYTVKDGEWCYYEYLNEHTIRLIFSRDSYLPKLNATVNVNVSITEGANGNFTYDNTFNVNMESEKYNNYNGMYMVVIPLLNGVSNGGRNKKSISDLKKIIPREASSRGSIINTTDLNNYFNALNNENTYMHFYKKRDNPFERLYYGYLITKKHNTVYPTNTLPLKLEQSDFVGFAGNNNLVLKPGTKFYYYRHGNNNKEDAVCTIKPPKIITGLDEGVYKYPMVYNEDGEMVRLFEYMSPFLMTIDDDLIMSYFLTIMDNTKTFMFDSINTESDVQFVTNNMKWHRKFIYRDDVGKIQMYDNKYTMDIIIARNTGNIDRTLVKYRITPEGKEEISDVRVKVIMVLYADSTNNNPYRYLEAEFIDYEKSSDTYAFRFTMSTDDLMDLNNRINITGIYNAKPEALQHKSVAAKSHGYMNKNTYAKIYILADFGTKEGDITPTGDIVTRETAKPFLFGTDGIGNRTEIEQVVPTKDDLIEELLKNNIYMEEGSTRHTIVSIMRSNPVYIKEVNDFNGDNSTSEQAILRYLRANRKSEFVTKKLLEDNTVNKIIDSYQYVDLSRYTLCNVMSVAGGLDFYHDYSKMMSSTVTVSQVQKTDESGTPLFKEITKTDSLGVNFKEFKPIYKVNSNGSYYYDYKIDRIPLIKYGFLSSESSMQDFLFTLEERRKYMEEYIMRLEDTFGIDFKFVNTYGPSNRFYYLLPNEKTFKVKISTKKAYVYSNTENETVAGSLKQDDIVTIMRTNGLWGYIEQPISGWIKLSDSKRQVDYIDNVAISLKFALEVVSASDREIVDDISNDIKAYLETINTINEIHMPNIITLITNNYRDRLKYFEYRGVNYFGVECQHLYFDEKTDADICPEFINVHTLDDKTFTPDIEITVF